ncbi:MAG: TRAP transporter large permease subunit [Rhodospirillaceae bacterium]|nr:TRAP transporter large permease subunit [Rhodospirillaceae bacterium]MYB13808.1 TRAP transporter large permease subunit [Rhodospirillaceae bacterium]MYI48459.1 TRAP transporter large permease subunit [Rhodospirillaceae bacterium]
MEFFFLLLLILLMAGALASGYPVAFALPGSAILTILLATVAGIIFTGDEGSFFHTGGPIEWLNSGVSNFRGVYWDPDRDTLIAIPLFVFMGIMLERSKIAEDLLVTMAQLFGRIPGGLGISVVFVGALLAATTGIVGATVVAMGLISLPVMLRNKYSPALATGTISASGTLGQIIPPSIVLIILADQLSNATDQALTLRKAEYKAGTGSSAMPGDYGLTSASAGDMFLGAFLPGMVLVGLYIAFILVTALTRPALAPPVAREGKFDAAFARRVLIVLVPPLTLIFAVLGSILTGIATVNQAGAIGASGAMIMAGYRLYQGRRGAFYPAVLAVLSIAAILFLLSIYTINVKNVVTADDVTALVLASVAVFALLTSLLWSGWRVYKTDDTLRYVMVETAKTTSLVFIILIGAAMLTSAFRAFGGEDLVRDFLFGLPGGFLAKFALVMAVIFILGFFLDFIEIAVVVVPIIAPILLADPSANVTAVWLGVMIGVNIQTSFLTPPFGFALFYLRGVAPASVKTISMYKGVVPFITLQLVALGIVGLYPSLVNYLPNRISLSGENAPPPRNPRLQACIEERNFVLMTEQRAALVAAIDKASKTDISYLPAERRRTLNRAFKDARDTFARIGDVRAAEKTVADYIPTYRPLHRKVRSINRQVLIIDGKLSQEAEDLRRLQNAERPDRAAIDDLTRDMAELQAEKKALLAQVPADWQVRRKQFLDLAKKERLARLRYRRTVDGAYAPIKETRSLIAGAGALNDLKPKLTALKPLIETGDPKTAQTALRALEREMRSVAGTSAIRSRLSNARRSLRPTRLRRDRALKAYDDALKRFDGEIAWRTAAQATLTGPLAEYDAAIAQTIGLRLQPRLNSDQATDVAGCLANHRDISLNF